MNKDNAHEYLPLVQAVAEGKTIQVQGSDGNWYNSKLTNIPPHRYRIKPEPRTFDIWIRKEDGVFFNRNSYFGKLNNPEDFERITVQEVLK